MALAVYGASGGQLHGWFAPGTWPLWVCGVLILLLYVLWALRCSHPAVNLKLLRHSQGALSVGVCVLVAVVMFAAALLIPTFMQSVQEYAAFDAGLTLLPQGLVSGVATALRNRFATRYGVRKIVLSGSVVLVAGTVALLFVEPGTQAWELATILSARGFATALVIQPLLSAMIGSLESPEVPDGSTLFNVAQRLGGSAGIALIFSFFQSRERLHVDEVLHKMGTGAGVGGSGSAHGGLNLATLPAGDAKVSMVDVRDHADVAVAALTEPGPEGKIYELTGPQALTHGEMAEKLNAAEITIAGRKV